MSADPSAPAKAQATVRFDSFEVDLQARELRKQGQRLRLQDQPLAVLIALTEQPGTVITREELRSRLWPSDTFVDFDHSLNTAVNKLREALSDSATTPRFVETVARRGYRFIGKVEPVASTSPPSVVERATSLDDDLPTPHRGLTRSLFALLQVMYLIFYAEALIHWEALDRIEWPDGMSHVILIAAVTTALVGIPVRLYLLSAVGFDYRRLGENFLKIFPGILALDQLWAIAPFLIIDKIGLGAALGATAALLYVPFAERTLVRMAYRKMPSASS